MHASLLCKDGLQFQPRAGCMCPHNVGNRGLDSLRPAVRPRRCGEVESLTSIEPRRKRWEHLGYKIACPALVNCEQIDKQDKREFRLLLAPAVFQACAMKVSAINA